MHETELTVAAGEVSLAGTLTEPREPTDTVVVCLHGTGPMDRDQNAPGQKLNVFNAFARGLAEVGVATFRYDKRGCGASTGDYFSAGQTDLMADAAAVIAGMRQRGFARVVLLGHSEGTLLAARLAGQADAIVLVAPFVTAVRQLLLDQADASQAAIDAVPGLVGWLQRRLVGLFGGVRRVQERLIARIENGREDTFRQSGQRIPAKSMREMMALDIEQIYAAISVPTLAVIGGKDVQCPPADSERITALVAGADVRVVERMTHLIRLSDDPPGFQYYAEQIARPTEPSVIRLVADWVAKASAR